ncbi:MAG TPA: hypothetical protein VMZ03_04885, partial [Chitinophagaceae bacterium]|nr:hypothetical protein [Chitinophagaceae bacterium]
MKKTFLLAVTIATFAINSFGQSYDDGFISSHLSVNTGEAKFSSFVNEFRSGLSRVRNRELTSADGIASFYELDIRNYPKLDQVVNSAAWTSYNGDFSATFLTKLKTAIDKLSYQYDNMGQFRDELLGIAVAGAPSSKEAEVLALIDISVQEVTKEFLSLDGSASGSMISNSSNVIHPTFDLNPIESNNGIPALSIYDYKLPRWIKCGLGVIGSAIMGGLTGG